MGRVTRIALALALVAGTAAAQPAAPRATPPGPGDDGTHHREGEYGGVSPDGRPSPDAKRVVPPAATLGWIGYRPGDAGAELFLMAAQPFSVEQRLEDGQVVLTLVGVRKLGRNLRRPLDTRFFDGPLATASIHAAIWPISATPMPRLVMAGVPRRMPDGSNGLRGSNGTLL
jgi:hypothetical protein